MAERNWGLIQSGEVFEALVTAIIFFNDPSTVLLGRPGVDGGQDAKSGDGRIVYQAKFHKAGAARLALTDAKKEFNKIKEYRLFGHERYEQWKDASEWVLVTNSAFNPSDDEQFKNQIVPMFASIGLKASYWERARLDIFLDTFVDLDNSYFGRSIRSFLSLGEAKLKLQEELGFVGRSLMPNFVGRDDEMEDFGAFLESDSLFFVFHGAGGIGKTRLLYESGLLALQKMKWQVLWANVATMENTSAWFTTVVPEKPTLLLIDEPESDKLLRLIMEQVGRKVGRAAGWKVAISVRSHKDPVLRFLSDAKIRSSVKFLLVKALPTVSSVEMCEGLLRSGNLGAETDSWIEHASKQIAQNFSSHPIWISIAVSVLERDGNLTRLPKATSDLMELYYDELVIGLSSEVVALINYVALIGVVNSDQNDAIELICKEIGVSEEELYANMSTLVKRGLIVRRGANQRLYEIKPDVVRDFIVRRWLVRSEGKSDLSDNAVFLMQGLIGGVLGNRFSMMQRNILFALVRAERVLVDSGVKISFLRMIYEAVKRALPGLDARERISIVEILTDIASFSPRYALLLSRTLRNDTAQTARALNLFREELLTQEKVVMALGWFVFHAAIGAEDPELQRGILIELLELSVFESDALRKTKNTAVNDGKRAKSLLDRVLVGGPEFLSEFDDAVSMLVEELFERYEKYELQRDIISEVFNCLVAVRRHQSWFENNLFNSRVVFIHRKGVAWSTRDRVVKSARDILAGGSKDLALRTSLWGVLSSAHSAINQCRLGAEDDEHGFVSDLLEDLCWVKSFLDIASSVLTFDEISAARKIWQWHVEFETVDEILALSKDLEEFYIGTELAGEFDQLFKFDVDYECLEQRVEAKASELAKLNSSTDIVQFIDRALCYLGVGGNLNSLDSVAYHIGRFSEGSGAVESFMDLYLKDVVNLTYTRFASCIAQQAVRVTLNNDRVLGFERLLDTLNKCARNDEKVALLKGCYSFAWRGLADVLPGEHEFLRESFDCFNESETQPLFFTIVGWGFDYDWEGYKTVLYAALMATPVGIRKSCLEELFRCVYAVLRDVKLVEAPKDLNIWMFFLITQISNLENDGQLDWLIKEILKITGEVPLGELSFALAFREKVESNLTESKFKAVDYSRRISKYVEKVSERNFGDETCRSAVVDLVELMSTCGGSLSYYFPSVLNDVDPLGLIVPEAIMEKFVAELADNEAYNFKRVARIYKIGSVAWKKLARPVLKMAEVEWPESDEQIKLYSLLIDHGVRSWSAVYGQVPQLFIDNFEQAQSRLDSEADVFYFPFYEWMLNVAQHELEDFTERAKEERGE